jgi:uncharacterized DUF497 family protein
MQFEWDEAKNASNIKRHGIDFNDVKEMFNYPMLSQVDSRESYGEERWIGVGKLRDHVGVVVYTERYEDTIRIISARKATRREVKYYEHYI